MFWIDGQNKLNTTEFMIQSQSISSNYFRWSSPILHGPMQFIAPAGMIVV